MDGATITRHQAEIAALLQRAGWVSPGYGGPKLYEVGFRSCEELGSAEQPKWPPAVVSALTSNKGVPRMTKQQNQNPGQQSQNPGQQRPGQQQGGGQKPGQQQQNDPMRQGDRPGQQQGGQRGQE